jgi:hypothetical protein
MPIPAPLPNPNPQVPTHSLSFDLYLQSFPPSYATIPVCRGQPHPRWTWAVYVYGREGGSSGSAGQLQVWGQNGLRILSPLSSALNLNQNMSNSLDILRICWRSIMDIWCEPRDNPSLWTSRYYQSS